MDQPPSRQMAAQLETLHPETVLFEFSLLPPAVLLLVALLLFLSRRPFRLLVLSFNEVLRLCEVYWF